MKLGRSGARAIGGIAALAVAGTAMGRAGAGGHAGSSNAASGGHSAGHFYGGGVGGGGGSFGGLVGILIIALIFWFIMRRVRSQSGPAQYAGGADQAIAAVALAAMGASRGASPNADPGRPQLPPAVDDIRGIDPGFEMESFLQRAEMTFFLVKRGMQRNDAAAVRPFLDDGVFAQVSQYIGQMAGQHRHALFESLNVRAVHLDEAACDTQTHSLKVHFDLVYRLKILDQTNRTVSDEGADGRHAERWTFSRAAAARTPVSGDVTAAKCPSCGAELRLNLDGTCAHCRASVTNGTVDWVVTDVQAAAFVGYAGGSPLVAAAPTVAAGIALLRATDPEFSVEAFKARASKAFLSLQDAWCRQQLDAGRAFLSPGAYFSWSAQLEALAAEGRRNVLENLTIGNIDIIRIVHGRVFDDLTVRIAAQAADFEIDPQGTIVFGDRSVRPFAEDWVFQRSVGVATNQKPGTLENTCPSCGAPVALTQIGECRYCKAAVTSGKFDWVVSRIEQLDAEDAATAGGSAGTADGAGVDLALQVGGAIIGGLLSSVLSNRSSGNSDSSSSSGDDW